MGHPRSLLRAAIALVAFAATGTIPASAQNVAGWSHEDAKGVHFAYYATPQAELTVRCKGPDVEIVYYFDSAALDPALKGKANTVFAVIVDDAQDLLWSSTKLVVEAGVTSVGVGGRAASDLARDFATAARSIEVSLMTGPPQADSMQYNHREFPTYGAADAIKAAYAGCGIPF